MSAPRRQWWRGCRSKPSPMRSVASANETVKEAGDTGVLVTTTVRPKHLTRGAGGAAKIAHTDVVTRVPKFAILWATGSVWADENEALSTPRWSDREGVRRQFDVTERPEHQLCIWEHLA